MRAEEAVERAEVKEVWGGEGNLHAGDGFFYCVVDRGIGGGGGGGCQVEGADSGVITGGVDCGRSRPYGADRAGV